MDALDVQGTGHTRVLPGLGETGKFSTSAITESIDTKSRIGTIRDLERVLKDGCLAQLVERRPYKA